jgi:hypothetical protein
VPKEHATDVLRRTYCTRTTIEQNGDGRRDREERCLVHRLFDLHYDVIKETATSEFSDRREHYGRERILSIVTKGGLASR